MNHIKWGIALFLLLTSNLVVAKELNQITTDYFTAANHFGSITGVDDPNNKKPVTFPFTLVIDIEKKELVLNDELINSSLSSLSLADVKGEHLSVSNILSDLKVSQAAIDKNKRKNKFLVLSYIFPVTEFLKQETDNEMKNLSELAKDPNFEVMAVKVEL
ncbi:hypothetical protein EYS14_24200 [Alteromonadaceae bacterium M269]|nr:hypothetical protein EYS14_24200 [Alteromonadaceae bacterium M269]